MTDPIEPSVLDFLLAKLQFWNKDRPRYDGWLTHEGAFPPVGSTDAGEVLSFSDQDDGVAASKEGSIVAQPKEQAVKKPVNFPWQILVSLLLALIGQGLLEASRANHMVAIPFYLAALALFIFALWKRRGDIFMRTNEPTESGIPQQTQDLTLLICLAFMVLAFIAFSPQRFNVLNMLFWLAAMGFGIMALWVPKPVRNRVRIEERLKNFFQQSAHYIRIDRWHVLLLAAAAISIFFRTYQLVEVPGEMFSDQAEKLLNVMEVLNGDYHVFFVENTGREAFQFYLTAAVVRFFGTDITFLSLKIGTVLFSLLMLPYVYLLGKEVGNKWVGLFAVILMGVAYWPNVITRVGLRYIFYASFAAPTLYYFIRGLRRSWRNDFILSGIFLGIGLHGYSAFRFMPIVLVIGAGVYALHYWKDRDQRRKALLAILIIAFVSFLVFLPLMRYIVSYPEMFGYRVATRLGTLETEYPGNPFVIFIQNFFKASIMFFYDNGQVWVHSIPGRPALDLISAVLYFFGVAYLLARYAIRRSWLDLYLLISIPLLMMPSILSLAFPAENPSLNRSSAAIIPVFLAGGLGLERLLDLIKNKSEGRLRHVFVSLLGLLLLVWSAGNNFDLVFNQYAPNFMRSAWNTSELGAVIKGYAASVGTSETAYVVPFPHWVDTRLVGMHAGFPGKDFALWRERLPETLAFPGVKLFLFHPDDTATLEMLFDLYPYGVIRYYESRSPGREFYTFLTTGQ